MGPLWPWWKLARSIFWLLFSLFVGSRDSLHHIEINYWLLMVVVTLCIDSKIVVDWRHIVHWQQNCIRIVFCCNGTFEPARNPVCNGGRRCECGLSWWGIRFLLYTDSEVDLCSEGEEDTEDDDENQEDGAAATSTLTTARVYIGKDGTEWTSNPVRLL